MVRSPGQTKVTLTAAVPANLAASLGISTGKAGDVLTLRPSDAVSLVTSDVAQFGAGPISPRVAGRAAQVTVTLLAAVPAVLAADLGLSGASAQSGAVLALSPQDARTLVQAGLARFGSAAKDAATHSTLGTSPANDPALKAAYGAGPGVVGFSSLTHWKAARARVLAGTGDAKILCVGDSTTAGVGSDSSNVLYQGSPLAYPYQLAAMLNGAGIAAARGLGVAPPGNGNWDNRWSSASGWGQAGLAWGGNATWEGTTTAPMVYADAVLSDRYDVYYLTAYGAGTFTVAATGGSVATVNSDAAPGVAKVTVSAATAAATNTVTITRTGAGGHAYIIGVEPWLSTTSRVRVGNAGVGSSAATAWAAVPYTTPGWSAGSAIQAYAPDLTIVSLGINDAGSSTPVSDVTAALRTIIAAGQVSGDVALLLPVPSQASAAVAYGSFIPQYAAAQRALGLPYADTLLTFGSGDAAAARGRMWDPLHPNAGGYADMAQPVLRGLITA